MGRRFAVVADEVRKLAERTAASAQEIAEMVTAIQKNTEIAASVMQKGNELVALGVRRTEQAGNSMRQINDSSVGEIGAVADVSSALRERRIAGAEIAQNVERIAQMTEKGRNTASEVSSAAESLGTLAAELQNEVAKFKA
jgi:methyl-accepting chemotaxis protein